MNWLVALTHTTQDEPDARFFNDINTGGGPTTGGNTVPIPSNPTRYFRNLDERETSTRSLTGRCPSRAGLKEEGRVKFGLFDSSSDRSFTDWAFYYPGGTGYGTDPNNFLTEENLGLDSIRTNYLSGIADYEEERQMLGAARTAPNGTALRPHRVLLVDDNQINLEIMSSQLTSHGYLIDAADNGREALDRYRPGSYDLILTDIEMPEMDGYELTEEIRRLEAGTGRMTTIFAITASEFDLSADSARERGFQGYMLKPLDPDLLQRKLSDLRHLREQGSES